MTWLLKWTSSVSLDARNVNFLIRVFFNYSVHHCNHWYFEVFNVLELFKCASHCTWFMHQNTKCFSKFSIPTLFYWKDKCFFNIYTFKMFIPKFSIPCHTVLVLRQNVINILMCSSVWLFLYLFWKC